MPSCRSVLSYTACTIFTLGISQAIGVVGLLCTGVKAVYDKVQLSRYEKLQAAGANPNPLAMKKIVYYKQRVRDNHDYAKAFGLSLISLSLNYASGYLEKTLAHCVSDRG